MADGVPVSLAVMDSAGATELDVTYDAYGTIRLSVYHAPSPDEVAILPLSFQYLPSQSLAPIHASRPQEDQAVQKFYRDTWAANSGEPYVDVTSPDEILTSELTISKEHSRAFCTAVRNTTEEYLYPEGDVLFAPVEFTHILITDAFLRLMQSSLFGPGQASIVHLYNRLVLEENAPLLCVGDKLRAAVSVDGFVNTDSGKKMTILATVYCNDRKYATVDLGLLSRSYFIDTSRTFRRNRRQRIVVLLPSEVEVAALEAKDWFVYREDSADRLEPGAAVEFCLNSEYGFKSERVYSSVATTGAVEHSFDNGGYSLVKSGNARLVQVTVPNSNQNYARYSLDNNSIHVNPYVADYANLPGTITHGMWTSASTRAVLERVVTGNHPERIRAYRTDFVGMVLPRDELTTELSHVGMKQGRMLVTGQTSKVGGGPVMTFTAEIDQPLTAYLFTGQGSQTAGMGMDLYEQSPAARAIWDRANAHMLNTYDIDLMDIVRNNPAERTIYFDDSDGEQVQNRYMALPGRLGKPVISDITKLSTSYTFRSPTGLLNSTQFTQVALVANAMASVADLRSQGLVQKDALFAGHSLGEYAALAALGQVFSVEDVLDIVFYRGLIMQSAVLRDEHGHSKYSMTAINPSRVSRVLDEETLQAVVDRVRSAGSGLLQVVNYNVSEQQYVVAGTQTNLAALRMVLDGLKQTNVSDTVDIIPAVDHILSAVLSAPIDATPVRGVATIPLDGIDVPFHSEKLADRVDVFRQVLQAKTRCETLAPCELCGRYIPNLTGKTLELTREYFERVHEITNSPVIKTALDVWDDTALSDSSVKARLTWLLLVELLAYQLASPVQWIGTQRHLFENACVQRVVEVGPSPVLCGMADRTLRRSEYVNMSVSVLHAERDMDDVYYRHVNGPTPAAASVPEMPAEKPKEAPEPVQKPMPQGDTGTSVGGLIADVPLPALDVVHAVVAFKLKQQLSAVSAQQDIKTLTGGKSTLQNEIVADLQKEFGDSIPDKPEEMSLQELGSTIGTAGSLGKCTQPLVTRMFSGKMPGGFSLLYARDTLETAYGLGPQRQDALLLVALTMEPASRLGSDAEATAWLDKAAQTYATRAGISYAQTAGAAAGAQASGPVVSSAEMKKMQQQQYEHAQQQIEVLARYSGVDLRKDGHTAEAHQAAVNSLQNELDAVSAEFGDKLLSGVRPQFDVRKARHFDSYWNWARQDAYQWIQQAMTDAMAGKDTALDEDRVHRLVVRTDQGLIQLLKGAAKILATDTNPALEPARQFVRHLYGKCVQALDTSPIYKEMSCPTQPLASVSVDGSVSYSEVPRKSEPTFVEYIEHMGQEDADAPPFIHICEQQHSHLWNHNRVRTESYFGGLSELCSQGLSFVGKTALVTGCGRGSIGADIIRGLLMGGAKVLATTSSYSRKTTLFFEDIYRQYGARGSELTVVPFNQGSVQDIDALVRYIFDRPTSGHPALGWRLNYVFPFAAISDIGSTVSDLESHSELAQRVGLTNVMRLLGHIKAAKEKASYIHRPALVVMPLSPNHGNLGGDGLYGECKAALETVFNRWDAESWEGHLSIVGASIGWTRGTGLMNSTNSIAPRFEELGIRTFSTREMAFNILGLLHPRITHAARHMPVLANLGGRMGLFGVMSGHLKEARMSIQTRSDMYQLASKDQSLDFLLEQPGIASLIAAETDKTPLAKPRHNFPETKSYDGLEHLHHLQDMVNLDKVVVITGYGEFGAHGNAETRWEMEAFGQLSIEGCIELAWIMGLIRHHNGQLAATGQHYVGWVDAKSGDAVRDADIKAWYEEYILAHTGIRLIEPELVGGYDPNRKQVMREIQIQHDMEPFKASSDDAAAYKKSNGDRVDTWENEDGSSWSVRFLKGALIRVPAAASTASLVAGQLPTGWNAKRFGIPEDIIDQVDPITLYTLVAVVEALVNSGITDPYELYQYFHVSEVGSSIGSTLGGGQSTYDMLWRRGNDEDIGGAKLQEAFISTVQAWVNMLLMSGSGPVKPIAGACATALLSVDTAVEAIQQGKAKVVVAGGVEDLAEGSITEFEKMGATANTVNELASGRTPTEMSRPCTTTRSGFVEGQGASAVVLMSASAAMEYGAPIYGVVGMSSTATDKQGRSVPAPGKGVLGSARETASTVPSSLLDFNYRRQRLLRRIRALEMQMQEELEELDNTGSLQELAARKEDIQLAYAAERMGVQDAWGSEFWKRNYRISPLRGSLAVWGLTADDIGLASFHGTSTKANDQNESSVVNKQMEHLGRTPGHVLPVVCQKWITGHPKAGAAGFMLNGALQSLRSGVIPGNRNADNIDMELKGREYLLYLSKTIQTGGIKAALLKSFGFGQVGGELLIVHSDYILATLAREQLEAYRQKVEQRSVKANRYWQDVLVGNRPFVQVKEQAPYTADQEVSILLDPTRRAHRNAATGKYAF
ncbi:fatty acid synthase alpha subunit Lsd1 [Coemansia sp. RSA 552]|nr:fatty acid synthase alpha subunit Lsd1 [Coemansia sp. RSA 552]